MNILIIEDDMMLRKVLSHSLLELGHTVSVTSNGKEALDLIETNKNIDLIICDVMMPVLTGPTFILMLKKHFPKKLPQIIIISAVKDGEEFLKSIDIQYDHFMRKPIDFSKLKDLVTSLEQK